MIQNPPLHVWRASTSSLPALQLGSTVAYCGAGAPKRSLPGLAGSGTDIVREKADMPQSTDWDIAGWRCRQHVTVEIDQD